MSNFILVGKKPVLITNDQFMQWAYWFGCHHNQVRVTDIPAKKPFGKGRGSTFRKLNHFREQPVRLSTVFLGIDHGAGFSRDPVLFETMIFGGQRDGEQYRYSEIDKAIEHHACLLEGL